MAQAQRDILLPINKKVLVLGGTGAIGVYLTPELLDRGYEVFVTSRKEKMTDVKNLHFIKGDAKDDLFLTELLSSNQFDAIVDFMVYHTDDFRKRANNLLGNTDHYVFLSSYRVYSNNHLKPITEETPRLLDVIDDEDYLKTDEYALAKARQEDILIQSELKNWTILRPAITYSKERFQLGIMEAGEFLHRALNGKPVIFPKEMLDKETTMSWAGDVGKMIARVVLNEETYGQIYTVSTAEHHQWSEVIGYYQEFLNMKVKYVPLEEYAKIINRKYQINYDRMYDRIIDNSKILKLTDIKQDDLMRLKDGLRIELATFSQSPNYRSLNIEQDKKMDRLTESKTISFIKRIKPRTRIKQMKGIVKGKLLYDGAILSLSGYHNYGGLMQRYALQYFLKENGYKFKLFNLKFMLNAGKKVGNRKNTKAFARKYLDQENFSPRTSKYYRTYIVGSDQVWRDWFHDWKKYRIFFLSFVNSKKTKRIAYSVSFGIDDLELAGINKNNIVKIRKLIEKFDYISVREKSAEELVKDLGKPSVNTLDPTLLLAESHYSALIDNSESSGIDTFPIYYYLLDPNPNKRNIVKMFEEETGMKADGIVGNDGLPLPPVEKWLKGFRDSKLVITDSFHGIAFSIINRTPFIAFGNRGRGLSRMNDLLELFGLEDRLVFDSGEIDKALFDLEAINWGAVEEKRAILREESSQWLLTAIKSKKSGGNK